jgi:hypothetical protein
MINFFDKSLIMLRPVLRVIVLFPSLAIAQTKLSWKPAKLQLQTRWTKEVSPTNALKEYPRPQMVRQNWQNLNGLWDYAIADKEATMPTKFDGQILVPYPIESALSGVKKMVQPDQCLWYRRLFNNLAHAANHRIIIHFGAVDWQATVFVNGNEIGRHTGGYDNFSFDITDAVKNGENEIAIKVYDPTDEGPNPRGKQVLNPKDIWYTPTTGVWQTVWTEMVPANYIKDIRITPNVDAGEVIVTALSEGSSNVTIAVGNGKANGKTNEAIHLKIDNPHLWSPSDPFLYDLKITAGDDEVNSYFGMRKVEIKMDDKGFERIFLNNKYIFNLGVLDQGFWPDGIYTAPTDDALAFDIKAIKTMGFNTIRKHIKREPDRWYYWCDKLGMMVWQDMINPSFTLTDEAKKDFEAEAKENITELYNHPCITTYTLFNEKWGQYDQERLTKWIKRLDSTRLVNGHSGEILYVNEKLRSPSPNAYVESDLTDVHSYPDPMNAIQMKRKVRVLGEFGGIGVFIPDHQWNTSSAWGYITVTPSQLKWKYTIMNQHLKLLEKEGLSASIYTQPFDVEGEQNGLMTYDREVVKIPFEEMRKISAMLVPTAKNLPEVVAKNADITEPTEVYSRLIYEYLNGKKDAATLKKLATMAGQTNDAAGRVRFTSEYIALLNKQYSDADIVFIEGSTKKLTDPGFQILLDREPALAAKEQRTLHIKLMNIIYNDVIAAYVTNAKAKPDWNMIAEKVKPYGSAGEEMFLRAKTIQTYNQQDWNTYKIVAKEYIDKYGAYIKADEKKMFEEKL